MSLVYMVSLMLLFLSECITKIFEKQYSFHPYNGCHNEINSLNRCCPLARIYSKTPLVSPSSFLSLLPAFPFSQSDTKECIQLSITPSPSLFPPFPFPTVSAIPLPPFIFFPLNSHMPNNSLLNMNPTFPLQRKCVSALNQYASTLSSAIFSLSLLLAYITPSTSAVYLARASFFPFHFLKSLFHVKALSTSFPYLFQPSTTFHSTHEAFIPHPLSDFLSSLSPLSPPFPHFNILLSPPSHLSLYQNTPILYFF